MSETDERYKQEAKETDELLRQVLELGVEIPKHPEWWFDDVENYSGPAALAEFSIRNYLTDDGKIGVSGLIREKRAQITDRRIKWACQIIAAVTGLLGSLIGILAIILAMLRK
jgi:hypothetical protein